MYRKRRKDERKSTAIQERKRGTGREGETYIAVMVFPVFTCQHFRLANPAY